MAATYTINDDPSERIDFAGPYYVAGQALMVRTEDEEPITAPEDLSDTGDPGLLGQRAPRRRRTSASTSARRTS